MLKRRKLNIYFFCLLIISFFNSNAYADVQYYKCKEKISNVLKGESQKIKIGSIIGINYIKIRQNYITIKFKNLQNAKKTQTIISNQRLNRTSLGYEIYKKNSDVDSSIENTYVFIKLNNTYAFSRKVYFWSAKTKKVKQENYEYESAGRCIKINKEEFNLEKVVKVVKKEKIKKEEKKAKVKTNKNSNKLIKGERSFGLSWEGYDEFILGNIKFSEKDLIGILEFHLPNNDGICVGTYVLSSIKGTWSIFCKDKDINASGTLVLNETDGSVSGKGKDSEGKKVKFKVAAKN